MDSVRQPPEDQGDGYIRVAGIRVIPCLRYEDRKCERYLEALTFPEVSSRGRSWYLYSGSGEYEGRQTNGSGVRIDGPPRRTCPRHSSAGISTMFPCRSPAAQGSGYARQLVGTHRLRTAVKFAGTVWLFTESPSIPIAQYVYHESVLMRTGRKAHLHSLEIQGGGIEAGRRREPS